MTPTTPTPFPSGSIDYLDAVTRAAQYLAIMRPGADVWVEFGKMVSRFFQTDLVAIAQRESDGRISFRYATLGDDEARARLVESVRRYGAAALDTGFLSTEVVALPASYSVAMLPLGYDEGRDTLLVVGHQGATPLPRQLLDIYLAVARLMESTLARLGAEEQLRGLNEELERRVIQRTSALEEALHELQEINYSVSHDLRTPLRAIDGFARILLKEYGERLNHEGRRLLQVVRVNAQQMGRLIDDLTAYARAGQLQMVPRRIDMAALAKSVWQRRQADLNQRRVECHIELLPSAVADRNLLREVFVRLLDNALKFTREADPAVIEVSGNVCDDENIYAVRDNGIGFDMRFAGKLFGVFQRLHPEQPFEGTGMGLAVVRRIVERHGGRVWAESKEGEGATFYFTLPRADRSPISSTMEEQHE